MCFTIYMAPTTNAKSATFAATVMGSSADDASARVAKRLPEGFAITGQTVVRSARHGLWDVEVANLGGNVNECWVVLTSFGVNPSQALGSHWGAVKGLGAV